MAGALIRTINIRVENPNLHDLAIKDVPILNGDKIICSRLKREETPKSTFARYHYPTGRFAGIWWAASGFT
ncbi:putative transport protein YidE [Escherichia coli]|uniref:Putative transport protein YidE n=1 Tax=Escherichia coli TaxID=562 RepID=A0A376MLK1_ECOLX|nr:putative transport protein YidE [Escherichia coli]